MNIAFATLQRLATVKHAAVVLTCLLFATMLSGSRTTLGSSFIAPNQRIIDMNEIPIAVSVAEPTGTGFQLTPFEYYTQQGNGERSASTNCGPASVAMAIKYGSALGIQPTPQQVREGLMRLTGSRQKKFTNVTDVRNALTLIGASHQNVQGATGVWQAIHRYHTVVVPVCMRHVTTGEDVALATNGQCPTNKKAVQVNDKLYCYTDSLNVFTGKYRIWWDTTKPNPQDGHFVLVNGVFTDTNGEKYFYVYDPLAFGSSGSKYFYFGLDYLPKGKYRLWKYSDLDAALSCNGNVAVEVNHNPANPIPIYPATARLQAYTPHTSTTDDESIEFLAHETYPDGTVLAPGQNILKSWRVRNSGLSDFGPEYQLIQASGAHVQLYGKSEIGVALSGDTTVVSAYLMAPSQPGIYSTTWKVIDPSGTPIQGTLGFSFSVAGQPQQGIDQALFVTDVTLPDGTLVSPSQSLVKTWRLRNTGTVAWGSGYQLVFVNSERMNAPSAVNVPVTSPGSTADISVNLTAPTTAGEHIGYWRLRNPQGTYFGPTIRVKINVQPPSSYITTLTADPPSPANASQVRIHARVTGFPNFRAMRLKIDGGVVYEIGAPEFYYNWNTGGYAAGAHNLLVEVADQTDTSWSRPERRSLIYTLQGTSGSNNHAPNRPNPSSPYDWYVYYSGNTAQLCAQSDGDPDGDPITYYFDIYQSAQTWNSGWVSNNCVTTSALGPYDYQWRVKVRDNHNAESEWSDTWHFTLVNPSLSISELYFQPQDANSEQVKIRTCTTGQGGIGITMRVSVNDANDGSGNGAWHIIKEQGSPCFNDIDAPIWNTLDYGDGPHRVRSEAHGLQTGWDGAAVREEVYTLPHRRPAGTRLIAPIPLTENYRDPIYLNSRTIPFRWQPTIRASSYTLHVGINPSPKDDPSPVFRQTFGSTITGTTVTLNQDYPTLYWQVSTTNDVGSNASVDQLFGIDRVTPTCSVQSLAPVVYDNVFQVGWSGSDNLSGIRTFDIQYLDSGRGSWNDWLTVPVTKTYELFTGQPGHSYAFRCRATDNANNSGSYPAMADTSTRIDPSARPPAPWWNSAYTGKRNLTILNNMASVTLPAGYPVHLHFDSGTSPSAAEIYNASQSTPKCNDLRIVHNDATEVQRVVQNCSPSAIDIWFRTQVGIAGGASNNTAHQLYYGNATPATPLADPNQVWYPYREGDTAYLYFFQEGSGSTAYDSSGNGRNCTINPSVVWQPSKFGNGLRFNRANSGNSQSLNCSNATALSSFTIEFWYKADSDDGGRVAGQLGSGQLDWLLQVFERRIRLDVWPCPSCGSSEVRSNFSLNDAAYAGKWNHIAVTFNGGNEVKFYINGILDSTKYLAQSGINTYSPPLEIGSVEGIDQIKSNLGAFRISSGVKTSFPYGSFANITTEPTLAAGVIINPPATGSPNLAILDLAVFPNPSGGVIAQTVVKNDGTRDSENGFYADLYLNHVPTGTGDYTGSFRTWINDPIAAGNTLTLTTLITDLPALLGQNLSALTPLTESSGTLYAQVDSTGAVSETTKLDNIFSTGVTACVATPDVYESDDTPVTASSIMLGQTQRHNFSGPGDRDWVSFAAQGGVTYTLRTLNLGPSADTYLYVYDTDATTLLASNDDDGGSLASSIDWTAPATGTYFALVQHWNPNLGGCGTAYDLAFMRAFTHKIFLPSVIKSG